MKPRKSKKNLVIRNNIHFFQIPRHTEIYISPDGRSISEITEERRVEPNHISYIIHESSVYRNPPILVSKKNRKTKKHLRKSRRKIWP